MDRVEDAAVGVRLRDLGAIASTLGAVVEPAQIGDALAVACRAVGAERGAVLVLDRATEQLRFRAAFGIEPEVLQAWDGFSIDADVPAAEAVRSAVPVVLATRAERNARYPQLGTTPPHHEHALVCLPVPVGGGVGGVLTLTLPPERPPDGDELTFLGVVAALCGQALDRIELFRRATASAERQAFLGEASRLLSLSLEVVPTLVRLADLVVPAVADSLSVYLREAGELVPYVIRHADPAAERAMHALSARTGNVARSPALEAVAGGAGPIVIPSLPARLVLASADDAEEEALLRALDLHSVSMLPLVSQARIVGVLAMTMSNASGRRFTQDDLPFLEDLAARAATALDNAMAHHASREMSELLQRSLLPPVEPRIPGLDVAVFYRAAGQGRVGGDVYDAFRLDGTDDEWVVLVGDVSGKGVEAAATTSVLRHTLRAVAGHDRGPAAMLADVNRAVIEADLGERFATAVVAVVQVRPDGTTVRLACAGHPLPLVRAADGVVREVGTPGAALGLTPELECPESSFELRPGDLLLLFTDGLLEARSPSGAFANALVDRSLRGSVSMDAAATVAALRAAVDELEQGSARDDLAILAVAHPRPPADRRSVVFAGIPSRLVLDLDAYLDELLRELELARLGGREDDGQRLLRIIVEALTHYTGVRTASRTQAVAALVAGEPTVDIHLDLSPAAAAAATQVLSLVDEVIDYLRDGPLLTLPPHPDVINLLRWFLQSVGTAADEGEALRAPFVPDDSVVEQRAVHELRLAEVPDIEVLGSASCTLSPEPSSVARARRFLLEQAETWNLSDAAARAVVPLSELVTNAVLHTATDVRLTVFRLADGLLVSVRDGSLELPHASGRFVTAATGRGLQLVHELAEQAGLVQHTDGKTIWFEIRAES